jgi:hypothetical protein
MQVIRRKSKGLRTKVGVDGEKGEALGEGGASGDGPLEARFLEETKTIALN